MKLVYVILYKVPGGLPILIGVGNGPGGSLCLPAQKLRGRYVGPGKPFGPLG